MALKMFKDKIVPRIGDLVRPSMLNNITGIVVAVKNNEDDISSEFYKNKPRKIFIVQWIGSPAWVTGLAKKELVRGERGHCMTVVCVC